MIKFKLAVENKDAIQHQAVSVYIETRRNISETIRKFGGDGGHDAQCGHPSECLLRRETKCVCVCVCVQCVRVVAPSSTCDRTVTSDSSSDSSVTYPCVGEIAILSTDVTHWGYKHSAALMAICVGAAWD